MEHTTPAIGLSHVFPTQPDDDILEFQSVDDVSGTLLISAVGKDFWLAAVEITQNGGTVIRWRLRLIPDVPVLPHKFSGILSVNGHPPTIILNRPFKFEIYIEKQPTNYAEFNGNMICYGGPGVLALDIMGNVVCTIGCEDKIDTENVGFGRVYGTDTLVAVHTPFCPDEPSQFLVGFGTSRVYRNEVDNYLLSRVVKNIGAVQHYSDDTFLLFGVHYVEHEGQEDLLCIIKILRFVVDQDGSITFKSVASVKPTNDTSVRFTDLIVRQFPGKTFGLLSTGYVEIHHHLIKGKMIGVECIADEDSVHYTVPFDANGPLSITSMIASGPKCGFLTRTTQKKDHSEYIVWSHGMKASIELKGLNSLETTATCIEDDGSATVASLERHYGRDLLDVFSSSKSEPLTMPSVMDTFNPNGLDSLPKSLTPVRQLTPTFEVIEAKSSGYGQSLPRASNAALPALTLAARIFRKNRSTNSDDLRDL